jgi:hypothetical protein
MIGAGLTGCGGGGPNFGPETAATPTQETAITATEGSLTTLATVDTDGSAAAGAAFELVGNAGLLIATPAARTLREIAAIRAFPALDLRTPSVLRQAPPSDCEVITDTSVTWNHCTEEGFTIDGKISWTPGHVDMSVHLTGAEQGVSISYKLDGSMTASASAIQGNMTLAVSATSGTQSASLNVHWDIDVQIAQGCITSGTLTVDLSGSGTGPGGGGSVNGAVQVIWTGCHAFRVRNA